MTTASPDRGGLYAVPHPEPTRQRYQLLLALKPLARKALDLLLALPRGAAGWVIRHTQGVLAALGHNPAIGRVGAGVRALGRLLRELGPFTTIAAVVTVPPVWRAVTRAAAGVVDGVASIGTSVWSWTRRLLGHFGPTGTRIATSLETTGAAIVSAASALLEHPIAHTVGRWIRLLAGLIRPLAQSVLAHRLLARLIPLQGLRVVLEVLTVIALVVPGPLSQLGSGLATGQAPAATAKLTVVERVIEDVVEEPDSGTVVDTEPPAAEQGPTGAAPADEPVNRAERRARQQAQARARRVPKR